MGKRDEEQTMVSFQLPVKLKTALERRAAREGISRSDLIRKLLEAGLRGTAPTPDRLQQIHDEVKALRREVAGTRKKRSRG